MFKTVKLISGGDRGRNSGILGEVGECSDWGLWGGGNVLILDRVIVMQDCSLWMIH